MDKSRGTLTLEQLKKIIDRSAEEAATRVLNRLKASGRITYHYSDSFKKTEELLYLYPKLPEGNSERQRIDAALQTIRDHDYYGVIESRYFDKMTISEISEIYDCKYQNISKRRNQLVRMLAAELFPEDVAKEIVQS